jgi:hypothetical protein
MYADGKEQSRDPFCLAGRISGLDRLYKRSQVSSPVPLMVNKEWGVFVNKLRGQTMIHRVACLNAEQVSNSLLCTD